MRENVTFEEAKAMLTISRGAIVNILDSALKSGELTTKEREILYFRLVDWNSLENCGKKFSVTRERIRQIEAKAEEKLRNRPTTL